MGACESTDTCNTVGGTSSTSNTDPKMTFVPNKNGENWTCWRSKRRRLSCCVPRIAARGTHRPQALLPFVVVLGQDGSKLVGQVCNYCKNREASSNSMYGGLMDSGNAGFYTTGIKVSNGRHSNTR
jgi:hypothetical protein